MAKKTKPDFSKPKESPEEIQILMNSGFAPVHFAGNILRCETAAIYGLAAVQCVVNKF